MLRVRAFVVLCVALALPASAAASQAASERAEAGNGATVTRATSLEGLVLRRINALRTARGLAPLALSSGLSRSAAGHARSMATLGYFAHESSDGTSFSRRIGRFYGPRSKAWSVGENLAMFGGASPSAGAIVASWMASPPHRANLLRALFRDAGIGVVHNPAAGGVFGGDSTWVVTLDLGRR